MRRLVCTLVVVMVMLVQLVAEQSWYQVKSACGKIMVSYKGRSEPASNTTIQVYKSKRKDAGCCDHTALLLEQNTDGAGNLLISKLDEGQYFLALKGTKPLLVIPIWVTETYESDKCETNQTFTVDSATGKSEVVVTADQY